MANNYHQLSLKDTFSDCKDMFMDDVPFFFQLLEQHFDISLFIPQTFYNAFYQHLGRKRDYPLIHTKIWTSACSPEFKEIPRNGIPFTKSEPLWNVPSTI